MIKSRLWWAGYVVRMGEGKSALKISTSKPPGEYLKLKEEYLLRLFEERIEKVREWEV